MPVFGKHELTIDAKNRLLIPFGIREQLEQDLAQKFYVFLGKNPRTLELYPREYVQRNWVASLPREAWTREVREMRLIESAFAELLAQDNQGRVLIPEELMQISQIGREVLLVGVGDYLQVWRRDEFKAFADPRVPNYTTQVEKAREYSIIPEHVGAGSGGATVKISG
jgi:MraZ protein